MFKNLPTFIHFMVSIFSIHSCSSQPFNTTDPTDFLSRLRSGGFFRNFNNDFRSSVVFASLQESAIGSWMNNYGCHCMFDRSNFHAAGTLQPIDVFDDICKFFHDAIICTKSDDQNCDYFNTGYNPIPLASVTDLLNKDITAECEVANSGSTCEANICVIESVFYKRFYEFYQNGVLPDRASFGHEGDFDFESNCVDQDRFVNKNAQNVRDCCGSYETGRESYWPNAGVQECCHDPFSMTQDLVPIGMCF